MTDPKTKHETAAVVRNNELISALVDGELDSKAADFLIRRLSDDDQMQRHWQRSHMVRACLQREFSGAVFLVERVQAALEAEAIPERSVRWPRLMRMGIGGALAASVAVVAVVGLANRIDSGGSIPQQALEPGFTSQSTALDRQFNAKAVPAGLGANQGASGRIGAASATQQRINRYMIRHSQAAGNSGFISLAPVLAAPATVQSTEPEAGSASTARNTTGR